MGWLVRGALGAAAACLLGGGVFLAVGWGGPPFADADDMGLVRHGKQVYALRCASCHGRYLQGQALWELADQDSARRAPPHDQSGHTWQHGDAALFHMTKYGRFPAAPAPARSGMPAFRTMLSDGDILAVLAFIKASWPIGLRVAQATLNPGAAGMPRDAGRADWRFPLTCRRNVATGRPRVPPATQ